jgi:pyridinium-3,5-biscarboxylic acid mononucleotide synthase
MDERLENAKHVEQLAQKLHRGELSLDRFLSELVRPKTVDLDEVQLDLDRQRRCGYPEVVFGEGKPLPILEKLLERMMGEGIDVLATRISPEVAAVLESRFAGARYNPLGRTLRIPNHSADTRGQKNRAAAVAVITAGTSDLAVAEEAHETLDWMGVDVRMIHDVGVAGPHRLRERLHQLDDVEAVVVVAGMEGALPSVVGGYVSCPVIAVPTSVGYGANCGGLAALLSMLNSCAANVTVVNIDSGFKGGYVAGLIAQRAARTA